MVRTLLSVAAMSVALAAPASAPCAAESSASLEAVIHSQDIFNGVTVSEDGRIFLPFQRQKAGEGIEVGEWVDGKARPYPDAGWNDYPRNGDAAHAFVGVNALRIGPDGNLWVVDKGAPGMGEDTVPGGPKLVAISLKTNTVVANYPLGGGAGQKSFIDDFRFNGRRVYLTDAGKPAGILVLDLDTGQVRRLLDDVKSVTQLRPLMAEGKPLIDPKGKPVVVNADQLEVSPDGQYFYYQPCTGPLYRIETRWLDDPAIPAAEVSRHAELFSDTPSTGGTAIDAAGNIYSSDTDRQRIIKITPDGKQSTFLQDPRLLWVDAMWIDDAGNLWLPAAQMNRTAGFNHGTDAVERPTVVYKAKIDAAPVRR